METEVRVDPIDQYRISVISRARVFRPKDLVSRVSEIKRGVCPFCPGNEAATPPATLAVVAGERGEEIVRESGNSRVEGWCLRIVPNMYPAFKASVNTRSMAYGFHEVVIETPKHDGHPDKLSVEENLLVLKYVFIRMKELLSDKRVSHVLFFRNHGLSAGASLSHPHSQLMAMGFTPPVIKREVNGAYELYRAFGECPYCSLLRREIEEKVRLVYLSEYFAVVTPWALMAPFETWIMPRRHRSNPLSLSLEELYGLAEAYTYALRRLSEVLGDPAYNLWLHMIPVDDSEAYHWHIEVQPSISTWAGAEKGGGIFLVHVSPEEAAARLRGDQ